MNYYLDTITEKSQKELYLLKEKLDFILIGGWAVYLYTNGLKSKDIDIIINFEGLSLIENMYRLTKNTRLTKYEARKDEVQIDIYCPHYSVIGIPVEDLLNKTQKVEGFTVLDLDYLAALKIYTLGERGRRPKGRKDLADIISLHLTGKVDYPQVIEILKHYKFSPALIKLSQFLKENYTFPELSLNQHQFARIKKDLLGKLV